MLTLVENKQGYGLTHTGLALIQYSYDGYKDLDVIGSLNNVRERLDMIRRRYPTRDSLRRMRPHERSQLEALEREEDFLQNQLYARRESSQDEDTHSLPLRAIEVVVGGVLLGVTAITIISILATLIDRGMHSCGTRCNFLVVSVGTITILDTVLYTAASLFPFDGLIVLLLTLYVIGCTFNILRKFGVGVFGLNLFTMGKETTLPQAIIIAAAMLCVCVPAWLLMLATAAPQYMSFGSQTICDAIDPMGRRNCTAVPTKLYSCQITSSPDICTPSVISTILSRYMYTLPAFGAIFHISMWIFCAVVIASLFLSCWQPPKSIYRNGERSSLVRNSETLEEV
nr:hypothetical protein HK105_005796 [Polyrhizophydium stewartii]